MGARLGAIAALSQLCTGMLVMLSWATVGNAQTYPAKPIRFILPFAAGSAVDVLARVYAQNMSELWKQQILVDNRTGANGIIGTELAARAAELEYFHFEPEWFDWLAPYARFQRLADRLGCPFVHPLQEFQRARVPVFLPRDGHPNATGHALAAEKLAPAVAAALGASRSAAPPGQTDERATR